LIEPEIIVLKMLHEPGEAVEFVMVG
jgi:hypothetical protein